MYRWVEKAATADRLHLATTKWRHTCKNGSLRLQKPGTPQSQLPQLLSKSRKHRVAISLIRFLQLAQLVSSFFLVQYTATILARSAPIPMAIALHGIMYIQSIFHRPQEVRQCTVYPSNRVLALRHIAARVYSQLCGSIYKLPRDISESRPIARPDRTRWYEISIRTFRPLRS